MSGVYVLHQRRPRPSSAAFIECNHRLSRESSCVPLFATFHPALSPAARASVFARVDALLGAQRVPGLRGWCVGPPVRVETSSTSVSTTTAEFGGEGGWVDGEDGEDGKREGEDGKREGEDGKQGGDDGKREGEANEGREGMMAGNERAEGKDFGFAAEFEDMDAFRASLPHEWHHEIYRLVKRATVGKFFIYQIDTERGRGWRAAPPGAVTPPGVDRRSRVEEADAGVHAAARIADQRKDVRLGSESVRLGNEDVRLGRGEDVRLGRREDVRMEAEACPSEKRDVREKRNVRERTSHAWLARGWREDRRWRARL
ncbi:uncharacterized protein SCHCODRAFT_01163560 [Schizophyllum commune H4-8]|uniref:Stress-response A/B barrel domain-containing protein n=1 Tax=Schizophyllum commune (strain H4-8 / FGSC 9210) TaxID=578458 RepID=D8QJI2_SCHCM|nr:uncharacterized protein SCHCODRAFT_01163560 [Schizophyllum commune H4-8]KAI5886317.1 hypothetical protein SCHCODRAFT_01163560 [Schizophyllum commune H4-8]